MLTLHYINAQKSLKLRHVPEPAGCSTFHSRAWLIFLSVKPWGQKSVSPRATRTMLPLCCSATRAVCLLPQSITLCRFVPLVWETSSQQLKCQLLVTGFHLSFEIKNSVVQKVKHCNDVTVFQPCTLPRPLDKLRLQSHGPRDELVTSGNLQSLRKNVYSPSG